MEEHVKPPSDFDWVTARAKCSVADMFETLRQLAKAGVERINTFRGGTNPNGPRFRFEETEPLPHRGFTVWDTFSYQRRAVDFRLRTETIHVSGAGREVIQATLTLNDFGQCRFKVGYDELDAWQFLHRTLEWLFFTDDEAAT
jgi:hypothetical protein